jgi:hypothetical protein
VYGWQKSNAPTPGPGASLPPRGANKENLSDVSDGEGERHTLGWGIKCHKTTVWDNKAQCALAGAGTSGVLVAFKINAGTQRPRVKNIRLRFEGELSFTKLAQIKTY